MPHHQESAELVVHPVLVRGKERVLIRRGDITLRIELSKIRWLANQLHDIADEQESKGRS